MNFRDRACAHLSDYRKIVLGIDEEGIFLHSGRKYLMGHILPRESLRLNLLEPFSNTFFLSEHRNTKLHRFFHHLNSSQALCINLFYPLLMEADFALLLSSLGSTMQLPVKATFEAESELEIAMRRTSFDFQIRNTEGKEVFVEVKYTEDGFTCAKNDEEHRRKFHETYAPLLIKTEYLSDECKDPDFFLKNYQILRNLIHITPKSEVVFLFPRANMKVASQAENARMKFLTASGRKKFRIIYLEDLVLHLIDACRGGKLDGYYESFDRKYLEFTRKNLCDDCLHTG